MQNAFVRVEFTSLMIFETLSSGRESVIFLKSKMTPRYSNRCLGIRVDFFQFIWIPRPCKGFRISVVSRFRVSADRFVKRKSSNRQKLMMPFCGFL